jgi:hypothetical protein
MGHLPETAKLTSWRKGEPLTADILNWNFAVVHGWCETAMATAKEPNQATLQAQFIIDALLVRVAALEQHAIAQEATRAQRQWLPFEAGAQLLRQINDLRQKLVPKAS